MKKNVIIVGYPKSGTNWITRLVAELLCCPIEGNWGFDDPRQTTIESIDRISEFACFKSHHSLKEINNASEKSIYKIIYVVRDPRDVIVSGSKFFNFAYAKTDFLMKKKFYGKHLHQNLKRISRLIMSSKYKTERMMKAVLKGDIEVDQWCKDSWAEHVRKYVNNKTFIIRYEDMLDEPFVSCDKILKYIGKDLGREEMLLAIENQSIENRRARLNRHSSPIEKKLLRKGKSKVWRGELNSKQISKVNSALTKELMAFGYEV